MKKTVILLLIINIFILGWLTNNVYSNSSTQSPYGVDTREKISPNDWIKKDQIHVYEDKIVIDIKGAEWAEFENTNSMDPIIDEYSNSIELKPSHENQLSIGDIVSYRSDYTDGIIIHRIIEIGYDEAGWFAILKGDNNSKEDPGNVRFDQIHGVLVGILY